MKCCLLVVVSSRVALYTCVRACMRVYASVCMCVHDCLIKLTEYRKKKTSSKKENQVKSKKSPRKEKKLDFSEKKLASST